MAKPVAYEDMVKVFGEACPKAAYDRCLPFAEDFVAEMCWPNTPEDEDEEEAYARAVMAAAIADASTGGGHGIDSDSFTIGSFSMSGGSGSGGSQTEAAMRRAVRRALCDTNLLYAGLGGTR